MTTRINHKTLYNRTLEYTVSSSTTMPVAYGRTFDYISAITNIALYLSCFFWLVLFTIEGEPRLFLLFIAISHGKCSKLLYDGVWESGRGGHCGRDDRRYEDIGKAVRRAAKGSSLCDNDSAIHPIQAAINSIEASIDWQQSIGHSSSSKPHWDVLSPAKLWMALTKSISND
jgi:hypothetical protein